MKPASVSSGKPSSERRQVDQRHRVDRVERMLAVGGQPVEMLGAVVDRVEPPEEADAVLQAVAPVDAEVAEQHDFDRLQPPRLRGDRCAKVRSACPSSQPPNRAKQPEHEPAPEQVLAEEEAQIGPPGGAKEPLARLGGERPFQRPEDQAEEEEAGRGGEREGLDCHGFVGAASLVVAGL